MWNDIEHVRLQVDDDQRRAIDTALQTARWWAWFAFVAGLGFGYSIPSHALEPVANAERAALCHEEAQGVRLLADSRDQGG